MVTYAHFGLPLVLFGTRIRHRTEIHPLETHMNSMILNLTAKVQDLLNREDGQDLVEYGLLLALISTAAIASVQNVATAVNTIFTNVSTSLA